MSSPPATEETRETERGRGEKRVSYDQNQRETSLTFGTLASISTERSIEPQIRIKL